MVLNEDVSGILEKKLVQSCVLPEKMGMHLRKEIVWKVQERFEGWASRKQRGAWVNASE